MVQIDDIGTGRPRLVDRSVEAFSRSLYLTAPEDLSEEEMRKRKEEEQEMLRKAEEERLRLEEEEAKKNKKKPAPAAKKGQEEVKWEEIEDPEDVKLYQIEHSLPRYEKGTQIFNSEYFFELDEMLKVVKEFRRKIFEFLSRKKQECLVTAEIHDKEFLQMSLHLLDERIKSYYSMKGKIQTEIYRIRGGEITKHKEKY